jgi:hypothetical protein
MSGNGAFSKNCPRFKNCEDVIFEVMGPGAKWPANETRFTNELPWGYLN